VEEYEMGRIVVGVDSSDHAVRALEWAIAEARLREASLQLVHAYPTPEVTAMPAIISLPSDEELREAARGTVDEALERAGGAEGLEVDVLVEPGGAAWVITEAAQGADLLVLGARGLGGFRGLLLGSVSQQAATHSPCPVVIVPPEKD
jgi:nucleotide-binding universal stress UspA family protein